MINLSFNIDIVIVMVGIAFKPGSDFLIDVIMFGLITVRFPGFVSCTTSSPVYTSVFQD